MSEIRERFRVVVDGKRSAFTWRVPAPAVREARKAAEQNPEAQISIEFLHMLVQPAHHHNQEGR